MSTRDKPVLVIDAGTSVLRAVAVDARGAATRIAVESWRMFRPPDASEYARELDGAEVQAALQRLLAVASGAGDFAAVAFTGQREGVVFADARGQALLASPNIDARAAAEGMAIDADRGGQVYARTGHLPSLLLAPAKWRWLQEHRPDAAAAVVRAMPFADWLASFVGVGDVSARSLMCEIGLLGLDGCRIEWSIRSATPGPEGTLIGPARSEALAGAPVMLAGADTQCGVLGVGALAAGDTAVIAGWSAPVQRVTASAVLDTQRRTWTGLHVLPERWVLESNAGDTGRAWAWACELIGVTPDEADELASSVPVGSHDALMVLGRAPMNAAAMTAGVGALTFPLPMAMWTLERADVLRATLEAAAYAIRANVEQLEEVSGSRIDTLRLGGGMSRSDLFARTLADVLDRPVEVAASSETTAVGAAMLAFVAMGVYASVAEAFAAMAIPRMTVTPNMRDSATYDDCYARWRMLAAHMERAP